MSAVSDAMSKLRTMLNGTPPDLVGLDISSSAVKLLELRQKGSRIEVAAYAVEPLPANAVVDQQIMEPEVVAEAIRKVVAKSGTGQRAAAVAVSGPTVITKVVQLSAFMNEDDMEAQIRIEADSHIPYPVDEVSLDFQVLGPAIDDTMVDVLLAVCRREQVEARSLALKMAGMTPKVVDIQNHALVNGAELLRHQMPSAGKGKTIALIDIGSSATNMLFLDNMNLVYSREVAFGGRQLIEEIARSYDLTPDDAQQALRTGALPDGFIENVQEPFIDDIAQQIDRGLQFFFSAVPSKSSIDQILLTGGCALLAGLPERISDRLGVPAEAARPFAGMAVASRAKPKVLARDESSLLLAAGLAMRAFDAEVK